MKLYISSCEVFRGQSTYLLEEMTYRFPFSIPNGIGRPHSLLFTSLTSRSKLDLAKIFE